jgi:hypothetical protein
MILFPAGFVLFVSTKPAPDADTDDRRSRIASLTRRLWIWTGVAIAVYLAFHSGLALRRASFMWLAFFPLWFALAMPLLRAKDPGWGPLPRSPVRAARLVRRDVLPTSVTRIWIIVAAIWVILTAVTLAGLALAKPGARFWWVSFFSLAAGIELWFLRWAMHRSLIEPEPVPPSETAELSKMREELRNLKLYGWTAAAAVMMLIFSIPPLLLVWLGDQALTAAIVVGAAGGAVGGIGGGVFGVLADLRRARINRLCLAQSSR